MYVSHWLQSYVIRIANSPVIYAVAIIITLLATIAAVSLQTIRLMRTNPAEALKKE
jgi:ABC-type antimicrobial peptide transport system permease subunit